MQLGTHTPQLGLPPLEAPGAVRLWDEDAAPGSSPEPALDTIQGQALVPHDPAEVRAQIGALEAALRQHPEAVVGDSDLCPLTHRFAGGMYLREIHIPQGTVLTGKIHRHEHPNVLLSGEVLVVTETGGREHLTAPRALISPPGTKRAVYALTDVVWLTIHLNPDNTRDLAVLEAQIIAPDYATLAPAPVAPALTSEEAL